VIPLRLARRLILVPLVAMLWIRPALAAEAPVVVPNAAAARVTDEAVCRAIQKGTEFLTRSQLPDGTWLERLANPGPQTFGISEFCMLTLVYTGVHPNQEAVSKGLESIIKRDVNSTYTVCARLMLLAAVQGKLAAENREAMRRAMNRDAQWLVRTQSPTGGWGYSGSGGRNSSDVYQDNSNTQMAILALREAAQAGAEIPKETWQRAQDYYARAQKPDGSWNYNRTDTPGGAAALPGYGSMTAAGLASVFITAEYLEAAGACPCRGAVSGRPRVDVDRRMDSALAWLEKNFRVDLNPGREQVPTGFYHFWYYSFERVGSTTGYKYFGEHDWFREAAATLLKTQLADGSWDSGYGKLITTCLSTLFLYKGRGPVLFNKLQFDGQWNNHRRDIANLTQYFSRTKEQPCHWQIVNLHRPGDELHEAPVLYLVTENAPKMTAEDAQKLRRFTDTGGTVLMEASCGNPMARKWILDFIKQTWPEWPLQKLAPDHSVFEEPYKLATRPELWGVNDGLRTAVFYAPDDISCQWHSKALAKKTYLFQWGINLVNYATDSAPLRAKLEPAAPPADPRYARDLVAGPKKTVRVARLRHGGDWAVGANYGGFARLAELVKARAGVTLETAEAGVGPSELAGFDVVYVTASRALALTAEESAALQSFVGRGGLLWFEGAGGSIEFEDSLKQVAEQAGWKLQRLPKDDGLMTGRMDPATGYDVSREVEFRRSLRIVRSLRNYADLIGVYAGDKLIGVLSPLDVMFSINPYEACMLRGYRPPDATAIATNIVLLATTRDRPAQ